MNMMTLVRRCYFCILASLALFRRIFHFNKPDVAFTLPSLGYFTVHCNRRRHQKIMASLSLKHRESKATGLLLADRFDCMLLINKSLSSMHRNNIIIHNNCTVGFVDESALLIHLNVMPFFRYISVTWG